MRIEDVAKKYKIEFFINSIRSNMRKYNGKIILKDASLSHGEIDGEFCEFDMTIKCFLDTSSNYWMGVLAHEYCHFLQCINASKYWTDFQKSVIKIEDLNNLFKNGKRNQNLTKQNRLKLVPYIIKMELDCDKSAICLINKYKLPVNKKEYSSKANIILYKYLYWAEYGIWPSINDKKTGKVTDWKNLQISRLMSDKNYLNVNNIPKRLFDIFFNNSN